LFEISYEPGETVTLKFKMPEMHKFKRETRRHVVGAGREMLLAIRGLIDEAIAKTEDMTAPPEATEKTSIKVE